MFFCCIFFYKKAAIENSLIFNYEYYIPSRVYMQSFINIYNLVNKGHFKTRVHLLLESLEKWNFPHFEADYKIINIFLKL